MSFTYTVNEWDSSFFGYPVATITGDGDEHDFDRLYRELKNKIRLAYWFVDIGDTAEKNIASSHDALCAATRMTNVLELQNHHAEQSNDEHISRETQGSDELTELLYECAKFSRFKADPNFGEDKCRIMYQLWAEKAMRENRLFVYRDKNIVRGFGIADAKNGIAFYQLQAVENNFRRHGVAKKIMQAVISYALDHSCTKLIGYTNPGNEPVRVLMEQTGFKIVREELIYHFWL